MKENTEANEEWNKKVAEAKSAEDFFNLALEECSTEQERQTLILETLTGMYGDSADAFRENNDEVIAQNKASEKLNKTWAKIGEKTAPIVTAFTEGLADLAGAFYELIEDVDLTPITDGIKKSFKWAVDKVLPKFIDALEWCADNFDILKSAAIGFVTALAVYKITTFATTLVTRLIPSLISATTAQKAMNAAASSNPYALLTSAVIGLGMAIRQYKKEQLEKAKQAAYDAALATYALTDAEIALAERVNEAAASFQAQRKSLDENVSGILSQFDHIGALKDELLLLADAEGRVDEKNHARVDFIIGQLNDALGTEYERVGDLIEGYDGLTASIDETIQKKKTELLLDSYAESYAEAVRGIQQAQDDYNASVASFVDASTNVAHQQSELDRILAERDAMMQDLIKSGGDADLAYWTAVKFYEKSVETKKKELEATQQILTEAQTAYENNKLALSGYYDDIGQYETAQRFALEGNTVEAERILADRGYYWEQYAIKLGVESDQIMNKWELMALDAELQAKATREGWENGLEGYTYEMVTEAEAAYADVLAGMDNAYDDAYAVGEDLSTGAVDGIEDGEPELESAGTSAVEAAADAADTAADDAYGVGEDFASGAAKGISAGEWSLTQAASSVIKAAIKAAKKAADAHSPSRKMIKLGEDMGAGARIGLEESTEDVVEAADEQAKRILAAYEGIKDTAGQVSLRSLDELEANNRATAQTAAASTNGPLLEKILAAIENGQFIILDGDTLVGATANKMDRALGRRRVLASRGAIK